MTTTRALFAAKGDKPRRSARDRTRTRAFFLFIAPWLIGFIALSVIPLVLGFGVSLTNYDGLNLSTVRFVGPDNYTRAFRDPDVLFSLGRTLLWSVLNTPSWLLVSFLMALILNQKVKGQGFFRTLFYLPTVIPVVASVWIWKIVLDQNFGLLNAAISLFQPGTATGWLTSYALQGLTVIAVWGGLGGGMVIFLAGLQNIPSELIDAARIDGAGALSIFRHVTLPLMSPVIFFQLVMALISSFQQLVLPMLLAPGAAGGLFAPPRGTYLYMIHVYRQMFTNLRYGYGTALLWLLFIVVVVLTLVVFRTARYWVHYEVSVEGGER